MHYWTNKQVRLSRENPQVRTLTINWLWRSPVAWTLTIMWLQNESNVTDPEDQLLQKFLHKKCKENQFYVVWNRPSWMPPAAFLHPQNAPKSLCLLLMEGAKDGRRKRGGWEGRKGGKRMKGKGRALDPHNVGNRLTPLQIKRWHDKIAVHHCTQIKLLLSTVTVITKCSTVH